jgi:hypothetical protein
MLKFLLTVKVIKHPWNRIVSRKIAVLSDR